MLNDLQIAELCLEIYSDPPAGTWTHLWPTRFGFTGHQKIDGIDYIIGRGSKDPLDWWQDLNFTAVDAPLIGGVHTGFYSDVLWTWDRVEAVLGPHVVLGAHSLGAAESAIRGALMTAKGHPPARIVLFGCPRPFFQQGRDILERGKVPVKSYANPGDPVTTVPPWTILWPYVEPANFTTLGDHADPADTGFFRQHHLPVYIAGLKAIAQAAQVPPL